MSLAPKARVLSGYRRLFRARKNLFAGDQRAMEESRLAIKAEFVKNKAVPTVGDHFEGLMTMVDEAEDMLRHHIVRGELNQETGNYQVKIKPEHTVGDDQTHVEPITQRTVEKLEKPETVEVCKSANKN
ncbi:hypothetical protein FisN_19Lh126 [Fistulifera solaris]|uniref:Complex III assembly factor LYRM7 n=1 Tax=Fistulifera solaris TaxID=1519565 RepID=A0A1Z5J6Q6_FISSO|nr:hypothetical protein FisN_19Lh126 [Fistulifera solaris]|eukprot:GAX09660.1 hypothetical protein FisN_19Lh126 [Fistulifera solaris]